MRASNEKTAWLRRVAGWWPVSAGRHDASNASVPEDHPDARRDGIDARSVRHDRVAHLGANGGDVRPMRYFVDDLAADETAA